MNKKVIEKLAYYLWEKYGKPEGKSEYFWFMAENLIKGEIKRRKRDNIETIVTPSVVSPVPSFSFDPITEYFNMNM